MKKTGLFLLLLLLSLSLLACQQGSNREDTNSTDTVAPAPPTAPTSPPPAPQPTPEPEYDDSYTLEAVDVSNSTVDEETGTELARYSYRLYTMKINEEKASDHAKEVTAAFNAKADELRAILEESGQLLGEDALAARAAGWWNILHTEETTTTYTVTGSIISLKRDGYGYYGGAHPNTWASSSVFDCVSGAYIDPTEIADDPELFRATVTDQLLDQIAGLDSNIREGYFTGYEEVVARWNEYCAVFLEDGLEITFSTYELGPYAMGPQVFLLRYEMLESALGETGAARLGLK